MSATNAVHALLTTLFAGAAIHAVRHALLPRGPAWRDRFYRFLHARGLGGEVGRHPYLLDSSRR